MDQQKIGKFICEMRKRQNLTQKQLADKIGISDRTVSKWETGNGIPEQSLMLPLCEELKISVNELLSGEKLTEENYSKMAEENIMKLLKEEEKHSFKWSEPILLVIGLALVKLYSYMVMPYHVPFQNMPFVIVLESFVLIYGTLIIMLAGCGLLTAFFRSFSLAFVKNADSDECRKARTAVDFARRAVPLLSAAAIVINSVGYFAGYDGVGAANLIYVIASPLTVGIVSSLVLLPIRTRLELKIDESGR